MVDRLTRAVSAFEKHILYSINQATLSKYEEVWKKWCLFNSDIGLNPLQSNSIIAVLFLSEILEESHIDDIGISRMSTARSAIRFFHFAAGFPTPTDAPQISLLFSSAERFLTPKSLNRDVLSVDDMARILDFHRVDSDSEGCSLRTQMHLTVFLLMFLGLFRFSDAASFLVHRDLLRFIYSQKQGVNDQLEGVMIYVCKSKTDQGWVGKWVAVGATATRFCPVRLLLRLLKRGQYTTFHETLDCGPLLRAVRSIKNGQHVLAKVTSSMEFPIQSLSYSAFNTSLKGLVNSAGISGNITCHSARIGGASEYYLLPKVDLCLVRSLGRWSVGSTFDDVYARPLALAREQFFDLTRQVWRF